MRKALIVGCSGQDGRYLFRLATQKNYEVMGFGRNQVMRSGEWNNTPIDLRQASAVRQVLGEFQPDEVYFLAAFHHSSQDSPIDDRELIERSFEVNTLALNNVLSGIAKDSPRSRLFYAGSSRVFGVPEKSPQDETTPINPICPYGMSKAAGIQLCRYYRSQREVFASVGIFYNHESPLRPSKFISRKIVSAAVRISRGSKEKLVIGDLSALVDWGYAPDYVRAAWAILQLDEPGDFVIGSGVTHSVREFVEAAFNALEMDWTQYVTEDSALLTRTSPASTLCADTGKLYRQTGWLPNMSFGAMIEEMVEMEVRGANATADSDLYSYL
ncbi:MAG: GDP-mannose 4,6-dehydratase [Bryobacteraceae bacterium]